MADNDNGAEKSQEPTPRKLEQAREKGQVAFSAEANTAIILLASAMLLLLMTPWLWQISAAVLRWTLSDGLRLELTDGDAIRAIWLTHAPYLLWTAVFTLILFVLGAAISIAQVGWQPTLQPLEPKFDKLNPMSGLQRIFSMRGLMRFVINLLKLIAVATVAWMMVSAHIRESMAIPGDLGLRTSDEGYALWKLLLILAVIIGGIAAADVIYQRYQHLQDLMMTNQEVKEEMKNAEGDPHVKAKIRQIQRQMAQKRMMQEVPKADVVITNPTHVAVALKYQAGEMGAPVVLAKGYDEVAQRIKAIAAEHGIPMVENIALARALAKEVEIGKPIPGKWYQAVAEILAAVYKLRKGAA